MKKIRIETELDCQDGSVEIFTVLKCKRIPCHGDYIEGADREYVRINNVFFNRDGSVSAHVDNVKWLSETLKDSVKYIAKNGWQVCVHENNREYLKERGLT